MCPVCLCVSPLVREAESNRVLGASQGVLVNLQGYTPWSVINYNLYVYIFLVGYLRINILFVS